MRINPKPHAELVFGVLGVAALLICGDVKSAAKASVVFAPGDPTVSTQTDQFAPTPTIVGGFSDTATPQSGIFIGSSTTGTASVAFFDTQFGGIELADEGNITGLGIGNFTIPFHLKTDLTGVDSSSVVWGFLLTITNGSGTTFQTTESGIGASQNITGTSDITTTEASNWTWSYQLQDGLGLGDRIAQQTVTLDVPTGSIDVGFAGISSVPEASEWTMLGTASMTGIGMLMLRRLRSKERIDFSVEVNRLQRRRCAVILA